MERRRLVGWASGWRLGIDGSFDRGQGILLKPKGVESSHQRSVILELERFDEERGGAKSVSSLHIENVFRVSEHNDANSAQMGFSANCPQDIETVRFGQFEVEQDDAGHREFDAIGIFSKTVEVSDGGIAVRDNEDRVFNGGGGESAFDQEDVIRVILNERITASSGKVVVTPMVVEMVRKGYNSPYGVKPLAGEK